MLDGVAELAGMVWDLTSRAFASLFRKPESASQDPPPRLSAADAALVAAARAKYRLSPEGAASLVAWARSQEPRSPERFYDRNQPKRVVAESYDAIAERHAEWAAGVRQEERARFATLLVNAFPAGAELLELGCGTAGLTTQTLARRFRLTGVDISVRSVDLARVALPNSKFIAADMTTVALPTESFDAVAAFYSIIHVPREELAGLVQRVFTWLRPGGLFVATMNGTDSVGSFEADWLGAPMYWSGYDADTTRRLVEAAGFLVEALTLETADEDGLPTSFWWLVARRPLGPTG